MCYPAYSCGCQEYRPHPSFPPHHPFLRRRFWGKKEEIETLKDYKETLEKELAEIKQRIKELEK